MRPRASYDAPWDGDFAVRVSDGLRKPAGAIQNAMDRLMETGLTAEQRELAGTACGHAETLLGAVNDLLDLSHLEAGRMRLTAEAFDLHLIAEDVVHLGASKAETKGLDLVLRYSPRLPRRAIGDAGRVRQILVRLVDDAISRVEPSRAEQGYVWLDLECLPEPADNFGLSVRIESAPAAPHGPHAAASLGPVIADQIVKLMGGQISIPDPTTLQFTIRLRRDPGEWPARRPPAVVSGKRVLIIDRSAKVRAVLHEALALWDIRVEEASGEKDAMEAISRTTQSNASYWAVFVSTEMAGVDWESLARAAQPFPAWREASRLLFAPLTNMPRADDVAAAGFRLCLPRNIRYTALVDALSELTGEPGTTPGPSSARSRTRSSPASAAPRSFNLAEVLDRCAGDRALLAELTEGFEQSSTDLLKRLIRAVAEQDRASALACAQNVRARADLLSAPDLRSAADRLEHTIGLKHWSAAPAAISALKVEILRLAAELTQIVGAEEAP